MQKLNSFIDMADKYDLYKNLKDADILKIINTMSDFNSSYKWGELYVPRVTDIINSMIHNEWLMSWSNKLGFQHKNYETYMNGVANIGTIAHNMIANYISGIPISTINIPGASIYAFKSFIDWWDKLNKDNKVEIIAQEYPLICPYYGGTLDLLLKINDTPVLIDFKTSNYITYKHFIQLAAYRFIIMEGLETTFKSLDGIILQLSKTSIKPTVFSITSDALDNYSKLFNSLVQAWYYRKFIEIDFASNIKKDIE